MQLTIQVKLLPTPYQQQLLRQTMLAMNEACNYVSEIAYQEEIRGRATLQRAVYADVRTKFDLAAQAAIHSVRKVADANKREFTLHQFAPTRAVSFDGRNSSIDLKSKTISLWTLGGRQIIDFVCGDYQWQRLLAQQAKFASRKLAADLCLVREQFYLTVVVDTPVAPKLPVKAVVGVDMGVTNLATLSSGTNYSGEKIKLSWRKAIRHRASLQSRQTNSAKQRLRKVSGSQRRFQKQNNHTIAKAVVAEARRHSACIVVEGLKELTRNTRQEKRLGRKQRGLFSNWAFYQLRQFIHYKAKLAGIEVQEVDPRDTSRTCFECGYCDKKNRPAQDTFVCRNCGHSANADHNAACNIARRGSLTSPIVLRPTTREMEVQPHSPARVSDLAGVGM